MDKDNNLSIWFLKISAILIAVWYLLLLYRYPFNIPFSIRSTDGIMLAIYMPITFTIFGVFITSFAVFVVRTIRSISYGQTKGADPKVFDRDFYTAAEEYYLFQIRLLVILSFMVLFLRLIDRALDEALLFFYIFLAVFIIILMNSILKRLFRKMGDLAAPSKRKRK